MSILIITRLAIKLYYLLDFDQNYEFSINPVLKLPQKGFM